MRWEDENDFFGYRYATYNDIEKAMADCPNKDYHIFKLVVPGITNNSAKTINDTPREYIEPIINERGKTQYIHCMKEDMGK